MHDLYPFGKYLHTYMWFDIIWYIYIVNIWSVVKAALWCIAVEFSIVCIVIFERYICCRFMHLTFGSQVEYVKAFQVISYVSIFLGDVVKVEFECYVIYSPTTFNKHLLQSSTFYARCVVVTRTIGCFLIFMCNTYFEDDLYGIFTLLQRFIEQLLY